MYAWDNERNKKNFLKTRGMYAYAEVLGHWGLIRIDEINGEKVGAEIGMVNQEWILKIISNYVMRRLHNDKITLKWCHKNS